MGTTWERHGLLTFSRVFCHGANYAPKADCNRGDYYLPLVGILDGAAVTSPTMNGT